MLSSRSLLTLAALVSAGALSHAQTISKVVPQVAGPGELVLIEGKGLSGTTAVRFEAAVGGFVGFFAKEVAPLSTSDTLVVVNVPTFGNFAPPNAFPPGTPFGSIGVVPSKEKPLDLILTEGSGGLLTTLGQGSTQSGGQGRPVISFDVAAGTPSSPNPSFTLLLQNATPGSPAILAAGTAALSSPTPIGDGTLVVDFGQPFVFFGGFAADGQGEVRLPIAIPDGIGGNTVVVQWGVVDLSTLFIGVSNGLQATL